MIVSAVLAEPWVGVTLLSQTNRLHMPGAVAGVDYACLRGIDMAKGKDPARTAAFEMRSASRDYWLDIHDRPEAHFDVIPGTRRLNNCMATMTEEKMYVYKANPHTRPVSATTSAEHRAENVSAGRCALSSLDY